MRTKEKIRKACRCQGGEKTRLTSVRETFNIKSFENLSRFFLSRGGAARRGPSECQGRFGLRVAACVKPNTRRNTLPKKKASVSRECTIVDATICPNHRRNRCRFFSQHPSSTTLPPCLTFLSLCWSYTKRFP